MHRQIRSHKEPAANFAYALAHMLYESHVWYITMSVKAYIQQQVRVVLQGAGAS